MYPNLECAKWRDDTCKHGTEPVADELRNQGDNNVQREDQSFTLFTQSTRRQHAFCQTFTGKRRHDAFDGTSSLTVHGGAGVATQPPVDLQTTAQVLSQVDVGNLKPQDRTALKRCMLRPAT